MWTMITSRVPWLTSYQCKLVSAVVLLLTVLGVNVINAVLQRPWWVWLQIPVSLVAGYYAGRLISAASSQQHREFLRAHGIEPETCER